MLKENQSHFDHSHFHVLQAICLSFSFLFSFRSLDYDWSLSILALGLRYSNEMLSLRETGDNEDESGHQSYVTVTNKCMTFKYSLSLMITILRSKVFNGILNVRAKLTMESNWART